MLPWQTLKIVVVGDGAVGKTTLIMTYTDDTFPGEYIPYVCSEKATKNRLFNGTPFSIELWDTCAQDGYDRLRPLSYTQTDVFFICFSIAEPISLESVTKKWYPEVTYHSPHTPVFLVGTKLDLRTDETVVKLLQSRDLSPITTSQGLEMKDAIGARGYIECSSLTRENLETLFDEVLKSVITAKKRKIRRCLII